jgi:hypothetical protein
MNLQTNAHVIYETQVIERGAIVSRRNPKRNLLLDVGLDGLAVRTWYESFSYCVLGTGTTPTKRDSGAITASVTSGIVTASANIFEAADVGRLIKFDSGEEYYIDDYISGTSVSLVDSEDVSAGEFTIWYVNETGHGNEIKRSNTYGSDSGDNETTWDGSKITLKRTFIFSEESSAITYTEIGWSHGSSGSSLFGRDLIPGGDSISPGQQYKVVVRLVITPAPIVQSSVGNVVTGWDTSGEHILCYCDIHSTRGIAYGLLEPSMWTSNTKDIGLIDEDFTLPSVPAAQGASRPILGSISGRIEDMTPDSYVSKSFMRSATAVFSTVNGNGTIYGIAVGYMTSNANASWALKFDTPQIKDSDHKLTLVFSLRWGRTLQN